MAHSIVLSWTASIDAVDGYNVYRGNAAGAETTKVNTALVTADTFTDSAPLEGENFYVVRSSLGGVESVNSSEVNAVILPAPPTNLKVASAA
jgi:hypothetical protein